MNRVDGFEADGTRAWSWVVDDYVADDACGTGECRAEGVTADGEGLVVNWARQDREMTGGLLRLDPSGVALTASWVTNTWVYPHEVVREPGTDTFIVADAMLDAVLWVPDDAMGTPDSAIARLDGEEVDGHTPNGLFLLEDGGTTWLLVSFRGNDPTSPGSEVGRIVMYDITDHDHPSVVWAYPAEGNLAAPHDPSLHVRDGRWLLLYAQSHGDASEAGTVGVAELATLSDPPTYLADLRPAEGEWGYPRGARLLEDDALYVCDTPGLTQGTTDAGAVWRTHLPSDLEAAGASGAYREDGTDQVFVDLDDVTLFADGFDQTYRSLLWRPTW
jgi:hypothetical protein